MVVLYTLETHGKLKVSSKENEKPESFSIPSLKKLELFLDIELKNGKPVISTITLKGFHLLLHSILGQLDYFIKLIQAPIFTIFITIQITFSKIVLEEHTLFRVILLICTSGSFCDERLVLYVKPKLDSGMPR